MGIVERLRERASAARSENTGTGLGDALHFEEAADLIERLRGVAVHEPLCPCGGDYPLPDEHCTCGLTALLKEIEGD